MILTDYPWYFVLLCLLAGALYAAVLYFVGRQPFGRGLRWVLAMLRFLTVSVIAFLLLAPMSRQTVHERQKPHLVLAQDVSQSVRVSADSAFSLESMLPDLEEQFRVSYVPFGSAASTNIGALLDRFRSDEVAALVLASDGIHNQGANPTGAAERLAFPVHCVALGDTTPRCDALIADLRCNRIAMMGGTFPVEITLNATLLRGGKSHLSIRDAAGRQLFVQQVQYNDDDFSTTLNVNLPADQAGLQRFSVNLTPLDGETSLSNNTMTFYVDVIDTRRQVVIFAHAPHPDVAAMVRAIESNPGYEVQVVMAEDAERGKWKPEGDVSLAILHNLPSRTHPSVAYADGYPRLYVVGAQTDLARFNALHSGLEILAKTSRTNEVTALFRPGFSLFNVDEGDIGVIETMPPLTAPFGEARLAADVQTLFTARLGNIDTRQPLVAATAQGEHRRAWVWGEGLWRWRLADYQAHSTHEHFDRLMTQLVALTAMQASNDRLQVEAARSYAEGEPVVLRAMLYNEAYEPTTTPEVKLTLTGDSTRADFTFRREGTGYSLTLPPLAEGLYRYRASADGQVAEGSFAVEAVNLEMRRLTADHTLLATLASLTGGEMYHPDQLADLRAQLSTLKPTIYTHTRYAEFLRLPLLLALIVLLLAAEWVLRKYHGEL